MVRSLPNPLEFLSFVFCLGNLLAGPYIEFTDFKDFIELKGVSALRGPGTGPGAGPAAGPVAQG